MSWTQTVSADRGSHSDPLCLWDITCVGISEAQKDTHKNKRLKRYLKRSQKYKVTFEAEGMVWPPENLVCRLHVCVRLRVCARLTDVELHNSTWLLSKTNWPLEEIHIQHRVGNAERERWVERWMIARAQTSGIMTRYVCLNAISWGASVTAGVAI